MEKEESVKEVRITFKNSETNEFKSFSFKGPDPYLEIDQHDWILIGFKFIDE